MRQGEESMPRAILEKKSPSCRQENPSVSTKKEESCHDELGFTSLVRREHCLGGVRLAGADLQASNLV